MKAYALIFFLPALGCMAFAQNKARVAAADTVLLNANIRTMSEKMPVAEAVAIRGGRIAAVGSNADIADHIGPETLRIDAKGRIVLPGFNDAHVHFIAIGNRFSSIDLSECLSLDDVLSLLRHYSRFLPRGRWILGGKWSKPVWETWSSGIEPTRQMIDPVTPDTPVLIYERDPDLALANSLALKLAGITRATKNPTDGRIFRDMNGDPTGLLQGGAIELVRRVIPADHTRNLAEIAETASNYAASFGITSVQDMQSDDISEVLAKLEIAGKLKTRVYDCTALSGNMRKNNSEAGNMNMFGSSMVRIGCLKGVSDGEDKWTATLKQDIASADAARFQVMTHAIGKKPNEKILKTFEYIVRKHGARDRRFRIEHAEGFPNEKIGLLRKYGMIASLQPGLFGNDTFYATLRGAGVRLAFGSDAPISPLDPIQGIRAAVNGGDGSPKGSESNGITIEEAIWTYTAGSAYAEFQENEKGTIEVGKFADLVMLSVSELTEIVNNSVSVAVDLTMVNGNLVFERTEK